MSTQRPVLVVGLQKSGTSLLLRLLTQTDAFRNPVRFEGRELWGDDPPFAPQAFPAGSFYQRARGENGHELGVTEATVEVRAHLEDALAASARPGKSQVLKNPYNTVRAPWLRALLPDAVIVAVVRRPLPNVFSLYKKHVENPHVHRGPEEGWWGVKPAGWQTFVSEDKVVQSAHQWARVNGKLWEDRADVDLIVPYHELCAHPAGFVATIGELATGEAVQGEFPPLEALDDEYKRGGPLESANRVFKRTGSLDLAGAERDEARLEPFSEAQRAKVLEITETLARALDL